MPLSIQSVKFSEGIVSNMALSCPIPLGLSIGLQSKKAENACRGYPEAGATLEKGQKRLQRVSGSRGYPQKRPKTLAEGSWKQGLPSKTAENACRGYPEAGLPSKKAENACRGHPEAGATLEKGQKRLQRAAGSRGYPRKRPKTLAAPVWKRGLPSKRAENACRGYPEAGATLEKGRKRLQRVKRFCTRAFKI